MLKIDKKFAQADNLSGFALYEFLKTRDKFEGDDSIGGSILDADSIQRKLLLITANSTFMKKIYNIVPCKMSILQHVS